MYSVLIVDDERFMREGIAKILPWHSLNVDYVETADSGRTALQRMSEHMPDIVLTDIEMHNMNGLTLIKNMNRMNPKLRIIVLTGHDNFSYVQECCRMEVHDYLLKPVEQDKLVQVIRAQLEILEQLNEKESRSRWMNRITALAEQRRLESCFRDFLKKRTGEQQVRQYLTDCGLKAQDSFQVAVIAAEEQKGDNFNEPRNELQELSADSVCTEMVDYHQNGLSFRDQSGFLVLILFCGKTHPIAMDLMDQVRTILQSEYDVVQKAYLGNVVHHISEIPDSYADALLLRDRKIYHEAVIQLPDEKNRCSMVLQMEPDVQRSIAEKMDDSVEALKVLDDYCEKLSSYQLPLDFIRHCCFRLVSFVVYRWTEDHVLSADVSITDCMSRIQSSDEMGVYQICHDFIARLFSHHVLETDDIIVAAKRYIDQNLDAKLSVSFLAERFHVSSGYFSKLFKKTAGVGCNYYIVCQRMEQARHLLMSTAMRLNDISEQVGYQDVKYFSMTFKKYTGLAPTEYREKNGKQALGGDAT